MIGGRAAHPNEPVWLDYMALQVSSGAPHCRHSAYARKLTCGVEAGWVRLKRRHGGRPAATNGAVSQSHPCSTELEWEWRRYDSGDLFLEPNYTAKQTFEPSKHNQQMMSCWDRTSLYAGLVYTNYSCFTARILKTTEWSNVAPDFKCWLNIPRRFLEILEAKYD